jgi:hypothetical protein
MRVAILALFVFSFADSAGSPQPVPAKKKLIEFGWDEPDPAFLRTHVRRMEDAPFDGVVFHLTSDFLWQGWSKRTFTEKDLAAAFDDLKNTEFRRFKHNLLRFNVTPGDVDWFDDFAPILNNVRLAAKAARSGRAAGILFDIEQYNAQLFNFSKQRDAKTRSWEQYAAQARIRGRETMTALQSEFPDLVVFLTWSYSLPFQQAEGELKRLATTEYGLLKPFLDGLFDAAAGSTKIVDGFESSYGYKEAGRFDAVRTMMKKTVLHWPPDRERYLKHASLGFGLWMDYDWRKKGWDERDLAKNHFTPQELEASLRKALATSDEFVWVYTENPRWWTAPDGKSAALPSEYADAVRRAVAN